MHQTCQVWTSTVFRLTNLKFASPTSLIMECIVVFWKSVRLHVRITQKSKFNVIENFSSNPFTKFLPFCKKILKVFLQHALFMPRFFILHIIRSKLRLLSIVIFTFQRISSATLVAGGLWTTSGDSGANYTSRTCVEDS